MAGFKVITEGTHPAEQAGYSPTDNYYNPQRQHAPVAAAQPGVRIMICSTTCIAAGNPNSDMYTALEDEWIAKWHREDEESIRLLVDDTRLKDWRGYLHPIR